MRRLTPPGRGRARSALMVGAVISIAVLPRALAGDPPEPRPDKALVYFVRTSRFNGSAGSIYLFADRTFVGRLPNGAYGYSYLEPGRRLFWATWTKATRELDLVPGETYYLDVWREITVTEPARGQALTQEVADLVTPDEDDRKKATKYILDKYDGAIEKESHRERVAVEDVAVPAVVPENPDGMLKIPAYTQGVLEFMESVTSEFTPAGTPVLLRLAGDVVVDGQVIVHGGTMVKGIVRESSQAGGYGKAGVMEISVPGLVAGDGTLVPLVAQLVGSGVDQENAAAGAGIAGGMFVGLAVRGREAFYLAGQHLKVWTRQDAWVRPAAAPVVADPVPTSPEASVVARCPGVVRFTPKKGYRPDDVVIVLETDARPAEVTVTAVSDFGLPAPLASRGCVQRSDGWRCPFDGWGLIRYLRAGSGTAPQPVTVSGRLDDGRTFISRVGIEYQVDR